VGASKIGMETLPHLAIGAREGPCVWSEKVGANTLAFGARGVVRTPSRLSEGGLEGKGGVSTLSKEGVSSEKTERKPSRARV
jgi:hypothetical protein